MSLKLKLPLPDPILQGHKYYSVVGITNPVTTTAYQHYLTVYYQPGMAPDFHDLRFTDPNGIQCPYWIESYTVGVSAVVWINIPVANTPFVRMYFGNTQCMSGSNGDLTFLLFDHFDSTLDTTKWTVSGSPTIASSIVTLTGSMSLLSKTTFGTGYCMRTRCYHGYNGGSGNYQSQNFCSQPYLDYSNGGTAKYQMMNYNGSSASVIDVGVSGSFSAYYYWDFERNGTNTKLYYNSVSNISSRTLLATNTSCVDATSRSVYFGTSGTGFLYLDFMLVRKYAATEPTLAVVSKNNRNPGWCGY